MGKKKSQPKNEEEEEEQEQFHVEVITQARASDEGDWEYWVKWAGYPESDNSWEPSQNVESCRRLLKSFWEHIGMDNDDVPYGTVFYAEESWIEKERKFFARNFGKKIKGSIKVKEEKVDVSLKEPTKGKAKVKSKQASSTVSVSNRAGSQSRKRRTRDTDSSEDDDSILSKRKKTKQKRIIDEHSISEPEGQTGQDITSETMNRSKAPPMSESAPASDVEDTNSLFSGPSRSPSPDSDTPSGQRAQRPEAKAGMSAAATNQVSSATKSSKLLPAHKERQRNPQVRMLSYNDPAVGVTGGSGIPTKNKLARLNSSTSTTSKPALPPSLVIPKKTSLPSFKKKKPTLPSPAIPSPSTSSMIDIAVATGPNRLTDTQEVVQSPVSLVNGDGGWGSPTPESPPMARKPSFSLPRTQTQTMRDPRRMAIPRSSGNPPDPMAEVNQLLASMMPPALAAPMYETTEEDETSILAPSLSRATPKVIKPTERIPRKWKWEGEVFIEVGEDKADHLCYVTLNEPTEPPSVGLRLSACTSTLDSLRLKKLHYMSDIFLVLPACGAVQQFCRVVPKEDRDENALGTLWKYMEMRRMFTYTEMLLDNEAVGLFFLFPSSLAALCDVFGVPGDLRDEKVLVGALVPWTLSAQQLADNDWKPQPLRELPDGPMSHFMLPESLQTQPLPLLFHYAIRVLKFPQDLLKWIADSANNRPYYICHGPGDGKSGKHTTSSNKEDQPGIETKLLQVILDHCRSAVKRSHREELRMIFVHIGDLASLRKVSNVGSRKYKQGNVRFFTYGTHESMAPDRWGVREVYPLGGIVTFTANAILEDPITTYKLMDRLDRHPLWMGFLTPSVMGAVAKLSCGAKDPLVAVDEDKFPYQILLDLIDGGNISLLTAPPSSRRVVPDKNTGLLVDNSLQWIITQMKNLAHSPRSLVEQCLNAIQSAQDEHEKDVMKAAAHDAFTQLGCMQYQPALMDHYRRFVLVVGKKDRLQDNKGLLELVTISNFDFKDNLFREPLC